MILMGKSLLKLVWSVGNMRRVPAPLYNACRRLKYSHIEDSCQVRGDHVEVDRPPFTEERITERG